MSADIKPFHVSGWALSKLGGRWFGMLIGSLLLGLTASSASAQNEERGRHIAERWCSACHAVNGKGVGQTEVPSFASIAAKHGEDKGWLRAWLIAPHPAMPDMNLSRTEIDDVVAYLRTLHRSK